jgi:hypothetical protein
VLLLFSRCAPAICAPGEYVSSTYHGAQPTFSHIGENLLQCKENFPRVEYAVFFFSSYTLDNEDDLLMYNP